MMYAPLHELLATVLASGPGAVLVNDGDGPRIAVIPLRVLSARELATACSFYAALDRGLLVVV